MPRHITLEKLGAKLQTDEAESFSGSDNGRRFRRMWDHVE